MTFQPKDTDIDTSWDESSQFADPTPGVPVLLALVIVGMIIGQLVMGMILKGGGIEILNIEEQTNLSQSKRYILRIGLLISHVMTFIVPSVIFAKAYKKYSIKDYFFRGRSFSFASLMIWGVIILFSYPLLAQLTLWNSQVPLADWMSSSQEDSVWLLQQTLNMESIPELVLSLCLVGIAAAVGEELIFRGILQRYFTKNLSPHIGIILASLIFGAFHLQLSRLLPLAFLGLILGYSYYYTKSIWIPILLHLANNGFQTIGAYTTVKAGALPNIEEIPDINPVVVMVSTMIMSALAYWAIKNSTIKYESGSQV